MAPRRPGRVPTAHDAASHPMRRGPSASRPCREIVQVVERVEDLQRDIDYALGLQLAAVLPEFVVERGTVDKFHHEVVMVGLAEAVEDPRDMLVVEVCKHVGLALEGADRLALHVGAGEAVDHLRECASARREPQILGEIDEYHAAAAERFDYPVAPADYA